MSRTWVLSFCGAGVVVVGVVLAATVSNLVGFAIALFGILLIGAGRAVRDG